MSFRFRRRTLVALLATPLLVSGCGSGSASPVSGVTAFPNLPHYHYLSARLTYTHVPPVGGAHSPAWLNCGVYSSPPPAENAVHSLEHGAVWITYKPGLAPDEVRTLQSYDALNKDYLLITPYAGLDQPIYVTAWGLQMTAQKADDPRITAFIKQYSGGGQGGEAGAKCSGGVTPAQALQYLSIPPPAGQAAPISPADKAVPAASASAGQQPPPAGTTAPQSAPAATASATP